VGKVNTRNFVSILCWILFGVGLLAQLPTFVRLEQQGQMPIDFLAYYRAAAALQAGQSPYLSPQRTRQIWQQFHQDEAAIITAQQQAGRGQAVVLEQAARPQQPGPYLYPPTLARLILLLHLSPMIFAVILLLAMLGFGWLWLQSTGAHPLWLLLIVLSWDVLSSLYGGNVEIFLLFATLLAVWLLRHAHPLWAAPLLALILVIKPFYLFFFAAFALIEWVSEPSAFKQSLRRWLPAGIGALFLIALEIFSWGQPLRAATFDYLRHSLAYQWFALPVAEQTPMSNWNRTPLQALVTAQMPAETAQFIALGLWLLLLGLTLWLIRGKRITFPLTFALALLLLYWGRPVGWTFVYLELVVVSAAWSRLGRGPRWVFLGMAVALLLSHWAALMRTGLGYDMSLLTLQNAGLPWETWLVVPVSWVMVMAAGCGWLAGMRLRGTPNREGIVTPRRE
jgi:hypothetical protein